MQEQMISEALISHHFFVKPKTEQQKKGEHYGPHMHKRHMRHISVNRNEMEEQTQARETEKKNSNTDFILLYGMCASVNVWA